MKRFISIICVIVIAVAGSVTFSGCDRKSDKIDDLILEESKLSFDFLWNEANSEEGSLAYGMVRDRYPGGTNVASIASVGFALAAIPSAIDRGWITRSQGEQRVMGTLNTIWSMENFSGFYYHFVSMLTAKRSGSSEVSGIDTAIMVAGAITAGEYFGGDIKKKADEIYARIDWNFYVKNSGTKDYFAMSYVPGGKLEGAWDWSGEQLIMYVLGAGAPNAEYRIPKKVYYDFNRPVGSYKGGEKFIYSWNGSLFTHQFSHAFIDFRGLIDEHGTDWYENSVKATINARNFCIDQKANGVNSDTYNENCWGLTACDTPKGYSGYLGALPSGSNNLMAMSEGTVAPGGALGSMPFAPKEVKGALEYYNSIDGLKGKYGFADAFNFVGESRWIASDVIGIDKGITVLMLLNYIDEGSVWKNFMNSDYVQSGLSYLGINQKAAAKAA